MSTPWRRRSKSSPIRRCARARHPRPLAGCTATASTPPPRASRRPCTHCPLPALRRALPPGAIMAADPVRPPLAPLDVGVIGPSYPDSFADNIVGALDDLGHRAVALGPARPPLPGGYRAAAVVGDLAYR